MKEEFSVLIHFPKDHSKPAWLTHSGKTRWNKRQATVHCKAVIDGKIWIAKRLHAEVKQRI